MTERRVLIALGGNAILRHQDTGTAEEQFSTVRRTCRHIAEIVADGYTVAVTHGNGPQVGDILLKNEIARDTLPPMPLDVCGAESQGMIGYMLQQSLSCELQAAGYARPVVTVLSQTLVHRDDPAFEHPAKPIGPYYTAMQASNLAKEKGWRLENEPGRGYRRVVPSPEPVAILEAESVRFLFDRGSIVIACGGGGIPVVAGEDGWLQGVEAVVDKDHTAALFAGLIGADDLLILTDVEKVALHFGRPDQVDLDSLTVAEAKRYLADGQFPPGTMAPKIEAVIRFIESGGERAIVSSLDRARDALAGEAGTVIAR
ncbi:carbamate kinase [Methanoculleus sp. FWC-SCC1]|uniref:Carbamate kinase n=1 Tax=Methanoculleus frigidifontis TaxID=2584085 RepID=A0ABT8M9Y1_9EURY|nr:carbamate kinase [Methanoculleus sp. FWC-SCC1]MDN7024719.1 carbamate kinase [Methanoculleus sp. FWC-SCC1]